MKPIIMGAESVKAVLDGRKTMTRRVDKINQNFWPEVGLDQDGKLFNVGYGDFQDKCHVEHLCPYGKIGDRLWVREEWKPGAWSNDGRVAIDYQASPELTHTPWICMEDQASKFIPRWLNEISEIGLIPNHEDRYEWEPGKSPFKWKRAMYMPRFASRITLEITDIRVERLQDITEDDAIAEGCSNHGVKFLNTLVYPPAYESVPIAEYANIWQKLNAKRGYSWESNLWVWVISFKNIHDQKEDV